MTTSVLQEKKINTGYSVWEHSLEMQALTLSNLARTNSFLLMIMITTNGPAIVRQYVLVAGGLLNRITITVTHGK